MFHCRLSFCFGVSRFPWKSNAGLSTFCLLRRSSFFASSSQLAPLWLLLLLFHLKAIIPLHLFLPVFRLCKIAMCCVWWIHSDHFLNVSSSWSFSLSFRSSLSAAFPTGPKSNARASEYAGKPEISAGCKDEPAWSPGVITNIFKHKPARLCATLSFLSSPEPLSISSTSRFCFHSVQRKTSFKSDLSFGARWISSERDSFVTRTFSALSPEISWILIAAKKPSIEIAQTLCLHLPRDRVNSPQPTIIRELLVSGALF